MSAWAQKLSDGLSCPHECSLVDNVVVITPDHAKKERCSDDRQQCEVPSLDPRLTKYHGREEFW